MKLISLYERKAIQGWIQLELSALTTTCLDFSCLMHAIKAKDILNLSTTR